jgi:cardiolipin synthase
VTRPEPFPGRRLFRLVPNALTMLRLGLVPIAIDAVLREAFATAFVVFVIAGLTDALDGTIARLANARTRLGAFLDPLADKALLLGVGCALAALDRLELWLLVPMVVRDLMIVGWVAIDQLRHQPRPVAPILISKINTAAQIFVIAAVIGIEADYLWPGFPIVTVQLVVLATTLASGGAYAITALKRPAARRV